MNLIQTAAAPVKPYLWLAGGVLWAASVAISGFVCWRVSANNEIAKQAKIEKIIEETRIAAMNGAADAISKIRVRNTTIQGRVQTIIKDNPVYRDCSHDDATLRLLNEALVGRSQPGDSSVPRAVSPIR